MQIETDVGTAPGVVTGNVLEVDVTEETTFVLVAQNDGGESRKSLTVEVHSVGEPSVLVQFGSTAAAAAATCPTHSVEHCKIFC